MKNKKLGKGSQSLISSFGKVASSFGYERNSLNGVVEPSFTKEAFMNTTTTPAQFYSPELTPETWLLPKSRLEILKWVRVFFNLEPYIQSILMMHAQYPICDFKVQYKDKDTTDFFNRKLFNNPEFSWIDFLEQLSLSYWKFGEAIVWGDWNPVQGAWNNFVLVDPSLVDYQENPLTGKVVMELVPTTELKQVVSNSLKEGRSDLPPEYIECVQENQQIPLDAEGTEPNYITGKKYSPPKAFMFVRKTDPGAVRGTPILQSLFKCVTGDTRVALMDGTNPTIKELADSGRKDFWVYGADKDGNIIPAKAECAAYIKDEETLEVTLDNGSKIRCTKDHPFYLRDMTKVEAKDLKQEIEIKSWPVNTTHKVVSIISTSKLEPVYCVANAGENHNFMIALDDGSGILSGNTLIYQDKIRLAQIAIADRFHLPLEIWSIGSYTGDPKTSLIPDDATLNQFRDLIQQATMQPPFSIYVPPYVKYEAVGVNGKLLSVYEDLGYVENQILVGLGVNKNLITGQGPSFSSAKQVSLYKLIKSYKIFRSKLEAFIKRYILLPISRANDLKDEYGNYIIPEIVWSESLQPEQDKEVFDALSKLWDKGIVSTLTLMEHFMKPLDYNLEQERLKSERGTVFDKGNDRLGNKANRDDLGKPSKPSRDSGDSPATSDGGGYEGSAEDDKSYLQPPLNESGDSSESAPESNEPPTE